MEIKKLAGVVAASTVVFSVGAAAPASAADGQVFGLQQTVNDPNGGEIGYTVTKFLPSDDAIPYPVTGQLYEVSVRADALNGLVTPTVAAFSAKTDSGQSYPALASVWTPQGLSGVTLLPGGHSSGKVYFDAAGEAPTSIVYSGAGDTLTWIEPPAAPAEEESSASEEESSSASEEESSESESGATEESESESAESGAADAEANGDVATAEDEG